MTLHAPTLADADDVARVAAESFVATFAHLYPPAHLEQHLATWMPPAKCAAQIADPAWPMMLWRDDDGVAGYAKLGPIDFPLPADHGDASDTIELHHLYLLDRAKGTGAAQALMAWVLRAAREGGHARLVLSVFVENHRAQAFYRRYGFVEIGKNAYVVGDTVDDDRIWMLRL